MNTKVKLSHLLHSMTSFVLFLIVSRLSSILLGEIIDSRDLVSLISFVLSSAAAVAAFFLMPENITYLPDEDELAAEEVSDTEAPSAADDGAKKHPLILPVLHTVATVAAMLLVMFACTKIPYLNFAGESEFVTDTASWLRVVSLVVIHPIAEEYLFRCLYLGELKKLGTSFAVLAQAIMFALAHNDVTSMIYALPCGVLLASLADQSGRSGAKNAEKNKKRGEYSSRGFIYAAIAHSAANLRAIIYVTFLSGNKAVQDAADYVIVVLGIAAAVFFLVLSKKTGGTAESNPADNGSESADEAK